MSVLQATQQDGFIQRNISITNPEVNGIYETALWLESHPVSACCKIMCCPKLVTSVNFCSVRNSYH